MAVANTTLQNFASGELSPKMRGRWDLPLYFNGAERQRNFISETQGAGRFRTGTVFVNHTRLNRTAVLIPFQFNDQQSYLLEFTDQKMRIYRNEGFITETAINITGATQADPVVITASNSYSDGDEVFITGVVGMTELNGKTFLVSNATGSNFEIQDVDGVNIDGTGYTAYSSGGTSAKIVEIDTPYVEADLTTLKYGQNADTMYLVHPNYEPRKLTRSSHTSWSLDLFTRTNDPFLDKQTISGATQADPCVITATGHSLSDGDFIIIEGVVGMTELNGGLYIVANSTANDFEIQDRDGVDIDSTGFTAYSSGGYASDQDLLPSAFAFYEGRAWYAAPDNNPEGFWGSRAPTSAGVARYDDYTTGSNPDDSVQFTLAPSTGKVDKIEWMAGTDRFLSLGTFSGISKVTGDTEEEAIAPDSINVKPIDDFGCADQTPVRRGNVIIYIQRGERTIRSFEFDVLADSFLSVDRNLVADHFGFESAFKQIEFSRGRPDILWGRREDGLLTGLTFKSREDVSGWWRAPIGGTDVKVLSIGVMPRPANYDQVWVVVERTINSVTRRYVEYFSDEVVIPEFIDYFTNENSKSDDEATWRRAMFEKQKEYIYVDSSLSYDGTAAGVAASASVTPGATSGTGVTFTASAAVFASTDVGREIWKKAINGVGYGRATITTFNSTTEVECTITVAFDSTTAIAAGNWYLTADEISGLDHLEGETVTIISDGGDHTDKTVASGAITLDAQASTFHVGLGYTGILKTMNLEAGGINGAAQTKPKNINRINIRFLNTLGARYGTDLYRMQDVVFRSTADPTNRPPPLFSGFKQLEYEDVTAQEKHVYIEQAKPLPCVIQMLDPFVDTDNF